MYVTLHKAFISIIEQHVTLITKVKHFGKICQSILRERDFFKLMLYLNFLTRLLELRAMK